MLAASFLGWGSSNPDQGQAHIMSDNYEAVLRLAIDRLCRAMNELADAAIGIVYAGAEQHLQKRHAEDQFDELF